MESKEFQGFVSSRANGRGDRNSKVQQTKDEERGFISPGKLPQDYPMKVVWKRGSICFVFVACILWILLILNVMLFHVWSCHSSFALFSAFYNRDPIRIVQKPKLIPKSKLQHRCPIPIAQDPDTILIPKRRTPEKMGKRLSYIMEDDPANNGYQSSPLFGGHESWFQREQSFIINSTMKVHCGYMRKGDAELAPEDIKYVKKCRFVVASGIFDNYDVPHQPSNISSRSRDLFCFLMVVDKKSLNFIKKNITVREDGDGGHWIGIWRLVLLKHPPYDEPSRNGKVPKILTHRIFPQAQYSIWIDGKMGLIVDPLLILERYLWRGNNTFAIAQHKHRRSIYEEADAIKRRKRYARPLVDLQMAIYRYEGMEPWNSKKNTISDVPEGAIIIREHTVLNNLFSCLWFNEVNLFTPRDQLSFGYVVYKLGGFFNFFMFPNCEYNSLFVLHSHTREHSSPKDTLKDLDEISNLKETKGGLGLWTPYPGNLSPLATRSKAG